MPFLKLRTQYINLDAITHVDLQTNAQDDAVTSATVYFLSGHQDSLTLRGEDAQALVAAIDPPTKDPLGWRVT